MNIAELASALLTHFSPEEREIPDGSNYPGRNATVCSAINAALQEVCGGDSSPWSRVVRRGAILAAPTNIDVTATHGSTTIMVSSAQWTPSMLGCSISLNAATVDNRTKSAVLADGVYTIELTLPFDGPTGTASAMVFGDCIPLAQDVLSVVGKVAVGRREIAPMAAASSGYPYRSQQDFGIHRRVMTPPTFPLRVGESLGYPVGFYVDTQFAEESLQSPIRILFSPSPAEATMAEYKVALRPVMVADLTSTAELPIPFEYVESVLLPVALKKLVTSPFLRSGVDPQRITEDYQMAVTLLKRLNPRKRTGIVLKPLL